MLKKMITGFLLLSTTTVFAMSLSQLNAASKAELMQINGIGEAKAGAILKERKKGKFKSFEDFRRVEGIGEKTATNVKNDVKSKADVKKVKKSVEKKSIKKKPVEKKPVEKKSTKKKSTEKKSLKKKPVQKKPTKKKSLKKKPTKKKSVEKKSTKKTSKN